MVLCRKIRKDWSVSYLQKPSAIIEEVSKMCTTNQTAGSLFFSRNFSRDYEEGLFSYPKRKWDETCAARSSRLFPYSAILPYRSFVFAMTKHSSKRERLRDPQRKKPAASRLTTDLMQNRSAWLFNYRSKHENSHSGSDSKISFMNSTCIRFLWSKLYISRPNSK